MPILDDRRIAAKEPPKRACCSARVLPLETQSNPAPLAHIGRFQRLLAHNGAILGLLLGFALPAPAQPADPFQSASPPISQPMPKTSLPARPSIPRSAPVVPAPRPRTQTKLVPDVASRTVCPEAGTIAVRSNATTVEYGGQDPANPALCIVVHLGRARSLLFGFLVWDPTDPGAKRIETAIRTALQGPPGATTEFDDATSEFFVHSTWTAAPDEDLTIKWSVAPDEDLTTKDEVRRAAHIILHRKAMFNMRSGPYEVRTHYWLDRKDGLLLKRVHESISPPVAGSGDFAVVSVRRPAT